MVSNGQAASLQPELDSATSEPGGSGRSLGVVWEFWKAYAEKIAFYQTTALLSAIYLLVVGPISLVGRVVSHHFLPMRPKRARTFWHGVLMGSATDLSELRKQG